MRRTRRKVRFEGYSSDSESEINDIEPPDSTTAFNLALRGLRTQIIMLIETYPEKFDFTYALETLETHLHKAENYDDESEDTLLSIIKYTIELIKNLLENPETLHNNPERICALLKQYKKNCDALFPMISSEKLKRTAITIALVVIIACISAMGFIFGGVGIGLASTFGLLVPTTTLYAHSQFLFQPKSTKQAVRETVKTLLNQCRG